LYASYGTDFQTGEKEARALQALDASSPMGFSALAFAQLGQGHVAQATETYQQYEKLGPDNVSDARAGMGDVALYEGRFGDAVRILEQSAAEDLSAKYPDKAAAKLVQVAYARLLHNQTGPAIAAAERALAASQIVKIRFLAGRIFAISGQTARARKLADELSKDLLIEPQAYGKIIEGEIALKAGDPRAAIKAFIEANKTLDTWIGHFSLGTAYLEANAFGEADSEFDGCIKRRGETLALFMDEFPTYGYFPPVYYYQGRVREGLKSPGAAESYKTYVSIRDKSGEDPLLPDARKRAGS
jgi:tetratricopeptide (TPR) repeat protein